MSQFMNSSVTIFQMNHIDGIVAVASGVAHRRGAVLAETHRVPGYPLSATRGRGDSDARINDLRALR
jgi:hypothetical protein